MPKKPKLVSQEAKWKSNFGSRCQKWSQILWLIFSLLLPVAHRSRNSWNGGGGEGGEEFAQEWIFFEQIVYCIETQKSVVTVHYN